MSTMIYYLLISFTIAIIAGLFCIPILHRLRFGQHIREEGPKSHQVKAGTPTMGGIIFIAASALTMLIAVRNPLNEGMIALYAYIAFGLIGALDDLLSIFRGKNLGLKASQKMILLILVSVIFSYYAAVSPSIGTSIIIPFLQKSFDLGILYVPFMVFYFASTTNGANLTDGLDGLATTVSLLIFTFFALLSFALGRYSLALFCAVAVGALLGFLKYNSYPAKVIMGDTGSLALGGSIAVVAMMLKLPLLILLVGGIYFIEDLSVLLQIASFKLRGKRIFKMSPIHHHFELLGWHETTIVVAFSITTVILCLIAFLSLSSFI